MDSFNIDDNLEIERQKRRAKRIAEMKKKKKRQALLRRLSLFLVPLALILVAGSVIAVRRNQPEPSEPVVEDVSVSPEIVATSAPILPSLENFRDNYNPSIMADAKHPFVDNSVYSATETASTAHAFDSETVFSTYGIVIDTENNTILAEQNAYDRISPASMTKILTILVAAEHVTDLDDTFTLTQEINNFVYVNDCSAVNFLNDEVVTVRDLFYGTILPSGADAALGLATYVAGSHEAFVDMMNEKLEDLGLSSSAHFTNCIGLYDEDHYCTMYDMAMIMEAAMNNALCREVLSAHKYTTSATEQHPEGIEISNWFLRRIEDKDTHGEVIGAKTGYVVQSRNCAASYGTDKNGKGYVIVTGDAHSGWRCIYDHVALYQKYLH